MRQTWLHLPSLLSSDQTNIFYYSSKMVARSWTGKASPPRSVLQQLLLSGARVLSASLKAFAFGRSFSILQKIGGRQKPATRPAVARARGTGYSRPPDEFWPIFFNSLRANIFHSYWLTIDEKDRSSDVRRSLL
jgi:hypothetical protein